MTSGILVDFVVDLTCDQNFLVRIFLFSMSRLARILDLIRVFKVSASSFKFQLRFYSFLGFEIFMKFVLFFTFCITFRVKPWRLMFGPYGKLWYMDINFFKKNAFKFPPYILRFVIAKYGLRYGLGYGLG